VLDIVGQERERRGSRTWWWCVFVAGEGPHEDLGTWRLQRRAAAAAAAVVEPSPRERTRGEVSGGGRSPSWAVLFLGRVFVGPSFSTQLFLQFRVFLFLTWNMANDQWNICYFIIHKLMIQ